jgi:hypothetical protein
MDQPKMSFLEWQFSIKRCKSALYWSDAPLDKDVYQPYTTKSVHTKVIVPVFDENTDKLLERIGSRKDIVVVLQMLPSNMHWFMSENYKIYSDDERPRNFLKFHDTLMYCGGDTVFASKIQMNTRQKFRKYVDRLTGTNVKECNVCFETGSDLDVVSCGVCNKTVCVKCNAQWCLAKGIDVSCPMCRAKPTIVNT